MAEIIKTDTGEQLDPQVVKVVRAIRDVESSNNYGAVGDGGKSKGAYQWYGTNWNTDAKQFLGDANAEMTPANQNKVAYYKVKQYKDQGLQPEEIAALWNGASKDATGKYTYNNPEYGVKFREKLLGQKTTTPTPQTEQVSPTVGSVQTSEIPSEQKGGIGEVVGNVAKSIVEPTATLMARPAQLAKTIQSVATAPSEEKLATQKQRNDYLISVLNDPNASPALKQEVANEIKATTQNVLKEGKLSDTSVNVPVLGKVEAPKEPADVVKDIGRGLQTVGLGMGLIGGGAAMGAGSALEEGGGLQQAALGGALGAATGGLFKGAGKVLGKLTEYLPERITRGFLPGINKETAQYAVNKGLGSPTKMLQESSNSIESLGTKLGSILDSPAYRYVDNATSKDLLPSIIEKFPNAGLDSNTIISKLMSVAPNQKALIEKLFASPEGLTLKELHTLNSGIGKNTFKMIFDDPTVKAGKDIASAFYHSASNFIKTKAPETAELFSQLSKEIPLNTALQKLIRSGEKSKLLTLKDIIFLMGGSGVGGPLGMAGAYATSRALSSPAVNLTAAGALKTASKIGQNKILQGGANLGSLLTSKGIGGLSNKIIPPPSY